ncbi:LAETG motif-containing sortase-dependent surface protein [Streptomyces sp. NPDC086010]|uniref:LAETG motif-containing sortase-dependent surface protein n=1 Tax=Streptomyces sp. NPDC086010 TaxID=3365745 RepID=UPI0037D52944
MFSVSSAFTAPTAAEGSPGGLGKGHGRGLVRTAAAMLATGLVAAGTIVGATAATAAPADETGQHQGGAVAVLDGLKTYGFAELNTGEGKKPQELPAGLFEMKVDGGGTIQTYCIDFHTPTKDGAKYSETPWDQSSLGANGDAGKVRWILQHSYPQVNDFAALAEKAGTGPLDEKTAAAGTQVAIWRFSDKADVTAKDANAEKLADWLEENAQNVAEPKASVALSPAAVSGKAGEKLGPITVHTDAGQVSVVPPADAAASGVQVTDKAGKPVTEAGDGADLYFSVPEDATDGSASLSVQASTSVPVGRVFAGLIKSQTMILAGSSESTVSATASATWAEKGAVPAVTAEKNCAKGGVDITAANNGDEPFTFTLAGAEHTVPAGETSTVTVPVGEDEAYDFTITGPGGFSKNFKGVLDCKTAGTPAPGDDTETHSGSEPSPVASTPGPEGDLAETGGSSATPVIAGVAIALVVLGGGAVFFLRRKKTQASGE